ncbi:MAG: hypothetical protein NC133_03735 [Prevotella sp.]|nr:hypothetical protein [Prevotella sp.]
MFFNYELKKIWRRVSPLLVLVVLLVTAVGTIALTAIFFNHTPKEAPDVSAQYAALQTKITHWTTFDRTDFAQAFDQFYADYKTMNASTHDGNHLVENYQTASQSFQTFYLEYYQRYIHNSEQDCIDDYLLVQEKYRAELDNILARFDQFFTANYSNKNDIVNGLKATNNAWESASLQTILTDLFYIQMMSAEDLTALQTFFDKYPANQTDFDYTDAYDYAANRFWLAIATTSSYSGNLSQYEGFSDYQDVTTSTRACQLASYRLEHPTDDFGTPFVFGNIFNATNQVSLFDFVFTNMEMAMIPVALLVMIWATCAFFTDNYQSTMITPVAAGKKRSTIILTKMAVIMLITVLALLLLTGVYLTCGLFFFHAYVSPNILCLFNGNTILTMPAFSYFLIYLLNLIFKLLPLIAICGLFSFSKTKPFVIIGFTALICVLVVLANGLLGSLGFYQFVPFMGLDPIRYFGAELLFAPMPSAYNLWFTFPVMLIITIILYWVLIRRFRSHDF